jgi:hypothetical protein
MITLYQDITTDSIMGKFRHLLTIKLASRRRYIDNAWWEHRRSLNNQRLLEKYHACERAGAGLERHDGAWPFISLNSPAFWIILSNTDIPRVSIYQQIAYTEASYTSLAEPTKSNKCWFGRITPGFKVTRREEV